MHFLRIFSLIHHLHLIAFLFEFHEKVAHLSEELIDLAHRGKIFDIFLFACEEIVSDSLDLVSLLGSVGLRRDYPRVC